jgi:hypothetical protein
MISLILILFDRLEFLPKKGPIYVLLLSDMPVDDFMIHQFGSHLLVQLKYDGFFDISSTQQRNFLLIHEFVYDNHR